jgi:hypothetical protein
MNMNSQPNQSSRVNVENLKSTLLTRLSAEYSQVGAHLVHQTVNEAVALASATPVPLLLLPVLAEEKIQKAAAWAAHQRAILEAGNYAAAA